MTTSLASHIVEFTTPRALSLPVAQEDNPYRAKAINMLLWCIPAGLFAAAAVLRAIRLCS